jgi:hypothetical protein
MNEALGLPFAKPFRSGSVDDCDSERNDDECESDGAPEVDLRRETSGFIGGLRG